MLLNTGYRARGFSAKVTPCGFSENGANRNAAAEWLRTAFHDMATGNVYTGVGGLDASLLFELGGDNIGAAFATTLTTFAPFLSSRSSMADIIALGVYTSVRVCSGPIIPIKAGRIDATEEGPTGVPLPQNSLYTFEQQFLRTGFDTTQMIAVTACGHTMGGVHAENFPQIVPAGSAPNNVVDFDSTTKFDEKIASEYTAGKTTDPLSVGPSVASGRASDVRVFSADGNATIASMADPATFQSMCQTMLQKLIEVVPSGVTLTDAIVPYDIKPTAMQLTLLGGGTQITFSGEIRVRTTTRPASQISTVQLVYKDRTGGSNCGSCKITATAKGTSAGFDDSFTFYGFSSQIPASSSISSFNVLITLASGSTETYDNNGNGYPMQDNVMLLAPQSCVTGTALTVYAAVRGTTAPSLNLTLKVPRDPIIAPSLQAQSVAMTKQSTVGAYDIYKGTYTLTTAQVKTTTFDITAGSSSDTFKSTGDLGTTCATLGSGSASTSSTSSSTTSSSKTSSSSTSSTSTSSTSSTSTSTKPTSSTSTFSTTTKSSSTTSTSSATTPTLSGYDYQGCYTDNTNGRVLSVKSTSTSTMSYKSCASYCSGSVYFGVEYGSECYCGSSLGTTSQVAETDCSFKCSGDATEVCGAGNRLNIFKATGSTSPINPTVPGFTYSGCYTDSTSARVLTAKQLYDSSMTVEKCTAFCKGYTYAGTEYASQCYCGNTFTNPTTKVQESDCGYNCAGNQGEFCGAGNRLSVYKATS